MTAACTTTMEEVESICKSAPSTKDLRRWLDAMFCKHHLEATKHEIFVMVDNLFKTRRLLPHSLHAFRSIACCNFMYKSITQLMSGRR